MNESINGSAGICKIHESKKTSKEVRLRKCIVTGEKITLDNDSAAHVIPSALGGRLRPKGVLSQEGNQILNDKVDTPLIRTLGSLMTLLGGSRDRGENVPVMMQANGTNYLVAFGKPIQLARPEYLEHVNDQKTVIQIKARTMKETRQLLGRVKSKYPDFDIDAALAEAIEQSTYLPSMLRGRLNVGPNPIFPAVFAMTNVYAASLGMPVHADFSSYIHGLPDRVKFEMEGHEVRVNMPPDTFYWLPKTPPVFRQESVTHIVSYFGDPNRKQALAYVELFNLPGVAVVLPYHGSEPLSNSYAIDVVTGIEQPVSLDETAYRQSWASTHDTPDLFELVEHSVGRVLELASKRMREREIERIISEVIDEAPVLTPQHIAEISTQVAELAVRLMTKHFDREKS